MVIMQKDWMLFDRVIFVVNIATELWYDRLADGQRSYHVLGIGCYRREDVPNIYLFKLSIPFVTFKLAVRI